MTDAAAIIGSSRCVGAVERLFERMSAAWESSLSRAGFVAMAGGPAPHRVRLAGWAVLSAAAVHVLLVGFERLVEPPMSGLGWIAAALLAGVCICRPDAVVAAWTHRADPRA